MNKTIFKQRLINHVILFILILCSNACKSMENNLMYEIPEKCDFDSITEILSENSCSPVIKDSEFQGIVINGPKQITFTGEMIGNSPLNISQINLSCILNLKYNLLDLNGKFIHHVLFVAVDKKTNQVFSGKMINQTMISDNVFDSVEGISADDFKDVLVTEYFNPNLVDVLKLPAKEAEYNVYATLADFKSNSIVINVSKKK